ncbi:hypothetical protein OG824_13730 [Streptomyces prunicolor]|uniref:hypothetical protein n=1 Tax=Streptomyces prunicolor TaxID=67348 RepID=UPI00225BD47A|nr:hypothetical protein [Streptomyces prunicolor]MCX5236261.1 hypothetical protein [Streptomyces prunicolor]
MTDTETTIEAPKKTTRKADPFARVVSDVRAAVKELGEFSALATPQHRTHHHLGRSAAWSQQHETEGTFDSLLLTHAFKAASTGDREPLLQLAAVALAQVENLDGDK